MIEIPDPIRIEDGYEDVAMADMEFFIYDNGNFLETALYIPVSNETLTLIEEGKILNDYDSEYLVYYDKPIVDVYELTTPISKFKIGLHYREEDFELTDEEEEIFDNLQAFFNDGISFSDTFDFRNLLAMYDLVKKDENQ